MTPRRVICALVARLFPARESHRQPYATYLDPARRRDVLVMAARNATPPTGRTR